MYIFVHRVDSQRIFYYCHTLQDLCSPPLINDLSVTHLRMLKIIVIQTISIQLVNTNCKKRRCETYYPEK
jgi:hypothetical protein